jgi:hypothetical protein
VLAFDREQCRAPHGTQVLAGGESLAVVCEGDHMGPGSVVRVDLTAEEPAVEESFEVGVYPDDLVFIPERS